MVDVGRDARMGKGNGGSGEDALLRIEMAGSPSFRFLKTSDYLDNNSNFSLLLLSILLDIAFSESGERL